MMNIQEITGKGKIEDLASYIYVLTNLHTISGLSQATSQLWYRGQANIAWDLKPTIYRNKNLNFFEREMIRDFKLLSNELISKKPTTELEWLFLMQHYGLQTRLLDWTESYLVALYFSVLNYSNPVDSVVWVLHPWSLNVVSIKQKTIPISSHPELFKYTLGDPHTVNRKIEGILPVAIRPTRNSARIVAQKGTFTIHGNNIKSLNKIIEEQNKVNNEQIFLYSIVIDGKSKLKILKELFIAGISYSVIFPELQGICNDIKIRYSDEFIFSADLNELK